MKSGWTAALLLAATMPNPSVMAQRLESTPNLLVRFDNEHDLSAKERLLLTLTTNDVGAGPSLLKLAASTTNSDTRWMAMRGMVALRYTASAPFLEASLKDADVSVRGSAARTLGDLRITTAVNPLLAMFLVEKEAPAIQQASLALRMLNVKAAAQFIRQKIPLFDGQTRVWLLQALGTLGNPVEDVPLLAKYLNEMMSDIAATEAIEELTGVSFGPRTSGVTSFPIPETLAAKAWWASHQDRWPQCEECRSDDERKNSLNPIRETCLDVLLET